MAGVYVLSRQMTTQQEFKKYQLTNFSKQLKKMQRNQMA